MNEIHRYYPSPSIRSSDPLDRYIAWQITQQKIAGVCILLCIFIAPAYLSWAFGAHAGQMAVWIIYRFILYLTGWAVALLALFTMYIVAVQIARFIQNRRY